MNRLKSILLAAFVAVVVVAGVHSQQVSAQSSAALSIAPKKTFTIEPGDTQKDTLTIRNLDTEAPLELSLRIIDFTYTAQGGTPKLLLGEDNPQTTWSLKPYLKVPQSVTIPSGGSKTLDISVTIPSNRGAGSLYSAIVYSTGAPEGGNVGLAASGTTLVFANIPGKVNQSLKLEKLGAYIEKPGSEADYAFVTMDEPQKIAYTLKNEGNVTESPAGTITVKSMFGQEYLIDNVNPSGSLALIEQTRLFTACIKIKDEQVNVAGTRTNTKVCESPGLWPGYYTASLELYYGQNGNITQEIRGNASFWYLPAWFLLLLAVVLIALALGVWRLTTIVREKLGKGNYKKSSRRKR